MRKRRTLNQAHPITKLSPASAGLFVHLAWLSSRYGRGGCHTTPQSHNEIRAHRESCVRGRLQERRSPMGALRTRLFESENRKNSSDIAWMVPVEPARHLFGVPIDRLYAPRVGAWATLAGNHPYLLLIPAFCFFFYCFWMSPSLGAEQLEITRWNSTWDACGEHAEGGSASPAEPSFS